MEQKKPTITHLIPQEAIESKIFLIRGKKVMLDKDLARLYEAETAQLTRQVRRNIDRFPDDFTFQFTREEFRNLKCQFGTSSWGGTRKLPYAFTEQGVAMLSSVLHSKKAIRISTYACQSLFHSNCLNLKKSLVCSIYLTMVQIMQTPYRMPGKNLIFEASSK